MLCSSDVIRCNLYLYLFVCPFLSKMQPNVQLNLDPKNRNGWLHWRQFGMIGSGTRVPGSWPCDCWMPCSSEHRSILSLSTKIWQSLRTSDCFNGKSCTTKNLILMAFEITLETWSESLGFSGKVKAFYSGWVLAGPRGCACLVLRWSPHLGMGDLHRTSRRSAPRRWEWTETKLGMSCEVKTLCKHILFSDLICIKPI